MKIAHRRVNLVGDVLPAPGRELVPWEQAEVDAQRQPDRFAPIINISLPRAQSAEDAPGGMTWERRTLQREPTVQSDFVLPVLQAFGVAASALILTALMAWAFGWGWRVVAVTFGLALAYMLIARIRHMDSLLWSVETLTGTDINRDGHTGQPATLTLANPAMARSEAARDVDATEQAAARAELVAFLHRCYTVGTAETAHGVKAGGPDRDAYLRQRDALMQLGIATWKNPGRPKAGWKMAVSYAKAQEIIGRHVL